MDDKGSPVVLKEDALSRLLEHDVMRAIIDPDVQVPGASNMQMRLAEFWSVIEIVKHAAQRQFPSREQAEVELFAHANGGGFGIRGDLSAAVLSLLIPAVEATRPAGEPSDPSRASTNARMLDQATVAEVSGRLGHYVYLLVDPRDSRPFYVGKGVGVRMMTHGLEAVDAAEDSDVRKLQRINEIRAAGLEHEIWIARYGMSTAEYTAVEATLIDTLGSFPVVPSNTKYRPLERRDELTNRRREDAKGKGMILLDRLVDELAAPPLTASTPLLLITLRGWKDAEEVVAGGRRRRGNGFKREWHEPAVRDAEIHELEMSTTAWWKLNRGSVDRRGVEYAVAVLPRSTNRVPCPTTLSRRMHGWTAWSTGSFA